MSTRYVSRYARDVRTVVIACLVIVARGAVSATRQMTSGRVVPRSPLSRAAFVRALRVAIGAYRATGTRLGAVFIVAGVVAIGAVARSEVPTELVAILFALAAKVAAVALYGDYLRRALRS